MIINSLFFKWDSSIKEKNCIIHRCISYLSDMPTPPAAKAATKVAAKAAAKDVAEDGASAKAPKSVSMSRLVDYLNVFAIVLRPVLDFSKGNKWSVYHASPRNVIRMTYDLLQHIKGKTSHINWSVSPLTQAMMVAVVQPWILRQKEIAANKEASPQVIVDAAAVSTAAAAAQDAPVHADLPADVGAPAAAPPSGTPETREYRKMVDWVSDDCRKSVLEACYKTMTSFPGITETIDSDEMKVPGEYDTTPQEDLKTMEIFWKIYGDYSIARFIDGVSKRVLPKFVEPCPARHHEKREYLCKIGHCLQDYIIIGLYVFGKCNNSMEMVTELYEYWVLGAQIYTVFCRSNMEYQQDQKFQLAYMLKSCLHLCGSSVVDDVLNLITIKDVMCWMASKGNYPDFMPRENMVLSCEVQKVFLATALDENYAAMKRFLTPVQINACLAKKRLQGKSPEELKNIIDAFFNICDISDITIQVNNRWVVCASINEQIAAIVLFFILVHRAHNLKCLNQEDINQEIMELVDERINAERRHSICKRIIEVPTECTFAMNVWINLFEIPVTAVYRTANNRKKFWITPNIVAMVDELTFLLPNFEARRAWMYYIGTMKSEKFQMCLDDIVPAERSEIDCTAVNGYELQKFWNEVKKVVAPSRPHRTNKATVAPVAAPTAASVVAAPVSDSAAAGPAPKRQKKSKTAPSADQA
jgi:hypothetical protein